MGDERTVESRQVLGDRGEGLAVNLLKENGWQILERNFNRGKGEVDIVARRPGELLFVEVRSVATDYLETPALTVNERKRQFIVRGARTYIRKHGLERERVRFDVVAVTFTGDEVRLEWLKDAFRPKASAQQNRFVW